MPSLHLTNLVVSVPALLPLVTHLSPSSLPAPSHSSLPSPVLCFHSSCPVISGGWALTDLCAWRVPCAHRALPQARGPAGKPWHGLTTRSQWHLRRDGLRQAHQEIMIWHHLLPQSFESFQWKEPRGAAEAQWESPEQGGISGLGGRGASAGLQEPLGHFGVPLNMKIPMRLGCPEQHISHMEMQPS